MTSLDLITWCGSFAGFIDMMQGQNKPEPKDLWLEPLVPAVPWKPCSDQRSWEPNGSPLFMHFKYCNQHSSSL